MVQVYRTNVTTEDQLWRVAPALDEVSGMLRWTLDLDDCDKVLRIEGNVKANISALLKDRGFECEELK
jgi:ethanolamine utilization protein EutQ (cupin superfamily)